MTESTENPSSPAALAEENGGERLSNEAIRRIRDLLEQELPEKQKTPAILALCEDFHASDTAHLLSLLSTGERKALLHALYHEFDAETLTYLDEELRGEVMEMLGTEKVAEALLELDTDDAVQVIEDMEEEEQRELLNAVPEETRAELEEGLGYPEDSAGRMMHRRFVAVPEFWQVGDVIDHLREAVDLPEDFYEIIVVDPRHRPAGTVMTSRIMQNRRDVPVRSLMKEELHPVPTEMDQEEVAYLFRRYGLAETPVINAAGRVVGVITIDDIVHVITEEDEDDFLRAGGIMDRDLHAGLIDTVKKRLPWLTVNLCAAAVSASVISHFEDTISQMVTLAVLMPVIASLSGNAGIQSATVSVRALAMKELQRQNAWPFIRKEVCTNLLNGLVLGGITCGTVFLIYRQAELAGIFALAAACMLTVAGLAGSLIPLILSRLKIDPAIASGVFLTTTTDMLSFLSFLGLATLLLV